MRELTKAEARRMRLVAHGLDRVSRAGDRGTAEVTGDDRAHDSAPRARAGAGRTPVDVVRRMVAMQGQDLPQVLRAIAIRSAPGTTLDDVRAAFGRGELVRSWAMRGTLFVSTPRDLAVLHGAVAARMRRQEWRMCTDRGIDEATAARAAAVLTAFLADGPRSRPALLAAWDAAGIDVSGGRGYHLLALLAYDELVRFGPFEGEVQLLVGGSPPEVQRAPVVGTAPVGATALGDVLRRFVLARGPVTPDDAAWWLGLPKTPVRASLAGADGLETVLVDRAEMLVAAGAPAGGRAGVELVPGFDEWVLGYRDRSLIASPEMLAALVPGGNGVFKPSVLVDGRMVGTWRWPPRQGRRPVLPLLEVVEPVAPATLARIERALERWPHR